MGAVKITALEDEAPARQHARRSLVAKQMIPKGKIIDYDDLTWKRPGHGISPKHIDEMVGKEALFQINEDEILKWNMLE